MVTRSSLKALMPWAAFSRVSSLAGGPCWRMAGHAVGGAKCASAGTRDPGPQRAWTPSPRAQPRERLRTPPAAGPAGLPPQGGLGATCPWAEATRSPPGMQACCSPLGPAGFQFSEAGEHAPENSRKSRRPRQGVETRAGGGPLTTPVTLSLK